MEPEPRRWAATYTTQLKKKRKAYHDGALLLHPDSRRLVLLDDAGVTIDAKFLRAGDSVSAGAAIEFPCHLVDVGGEAQRGHSGRPSEPAASRTASYRGGARPRQSAPAPRAFVNPPKSGGGGGKAEAAGSGGANSADSACQEWHAMYTAQMTQKAKKYHDGFVRLRPMGSHSKQVVLLDEDGEILGSRYLKSGECLEAGKKCTFPNYLIEIGEAKNLNRGGERNSSEEPTVQSRPTGVGNANNKVGTGATGSLKFISPQKFHYLDESQSEVTSSSNKPDLGKGKVEAASSDGSLMGSTDSASKEWRILYTTQLTQKAKKYHDGSLKLMQVGSHAKQIVLLDEDGVVLGTRYLKSGESIESRKKCQFPNYIIEVFDLRNQKNDVEPKHTSGEALDHTGLKNGENTSEKKSDKSKSPKFVSPLFNDNQKSKTKGTTGSNWPQVGKSTRSDMGDPHNFHDFQRGKPNSTDGYRRTDLANSTYSGINDPHKFNDFADFQGSKSEFSTSYSQLEVGKSTFSDQGKSTFGGMDDPHKFNDFTDIQRGKSGFATSYNRPEVGKSVLNISDEPLESCDLQNGISPCPTSSVGREVGISTFGRTDDSLRTASQILSIMKPPAGLSHFATQLRTSVQSCLKLDTVQAKNSISTHNWNEPSGNAYPTYDRQAIPKPAAFDGPKVAMMDIPASEIPNANEQKLESPGNLHIGNSNGTDSAPVSNDTSIPGLQEEKTGIADQLGANSTAADPNCGSGPFPAPSIRRCLDPRIQDLIDDCPSFDLGF
ncbi:uncharacterized protein [Lolium perenne]|uniref:uncharacterized protein isoform X1 n=1 Tax=Lolium perenne TaxID=4522 RepID=UPI0021F5ED13|nr:uncharacterized protein LOC127300816 isoform X1 [Lolium perenne]XP_051186952.1 uncharacterized protein LOC127300816 isoform X1 [Lolium perenne]XP_051186953.1 uncharacterized protein LOC127300816 isoform X1 [Lolium perenne]